VGSKLIIILAFLTSYSFVAHAISVEREQELNQEFKAYCDQVSKYVIKNHYSVTCDTDYHHYNSRAALNHYNSNPDHDIKIANYNLLHPGSNKNSYKDIALVAQIINEYDLVSAQELIPRLGNDMRHNNDLVDMIEDTKNYDLEKLYKIPGYILILEELRKLDPSWALITSPRGEASSPSSVHEMLGFFYRASIVRPKETEHCSELATKNDREDANTSFACYPLFRAPFFRVDAADGFSRKPFVSSFESGEYDFTIMNAHVIFTSPKDEETMSWISNLAFGVDDYSQVGTGVTKETYARFAEVRLTLEMLEIFSKNYKEQDLFFSADMNLESKISYWQTLMGDFNSFTLISELPTSLTNYRYGRGDVETNGFSSNYDHFIYNNKANKNCITDKSGKIEVTRQSYFEDHVDEWMRENYLAREETSDADEPYRFSSKGKKIMERKLQEHRQFLEESRIIVDGKIVAQFEDVEKELEIYKRRVFDEQLSDFTYYKLYRELISDHFPISITCKN